MGMALAAHKQCLIAVPDCRKIVTSNWSQKIALRAENKRSQMLLAMDEYLFSAKQFSVAIEATIFRIERRAIEAQRLQSIFTKISMNTFVDI